MTFTIKDSVANFTGTAVLEFEIQKADIADLQQQYNIFSVHVPEGGYVYTGKEIEPGLSVETPDVTDENRALLEAFGIVASGNLNVGYANNENAGTATMTLTVEDGVPNFTGTIDLGFEIQKADLEGVEVTPYEGAFDNSAHPAAEFAGQTVDGTEVSWTWSLTAADAESAGEVALPQRKLLLFPQAGDLCARRL